MEKGILKISQNKKVSSLKTFKLFLVKLLLISSFAYTSSGFHGVASRHHIATDIGLKVLKDGGNAIDAETAQEYGLINKVVKAEDLDSMVDAIANELASLAPTTMRQGLAAYNAQDDLNFDEAIPFLKDELAKCLKGEDAKEGITAFLEKRPPNWK